VRPLPPVLTDLKTPHHTTTIDSHSFCAPHHQQLSYLALARFNEKFERAYVEQAREDVSWERKQKECLDGERKLMSGVDGWVTGKRRYFTQWEDRPDKDTLDQRRIGPW